MSTAGLLELIAWILSAIIAAWLLVDVVRVSRRYDPDLLIDPLGGTTAPPPEGGYISESREAGQR
ncbi:hypothetical protein HC028_13630 [Planosporangium flavigriseum]|uniref:Uncharacterized protein n=1 Tax=Planosporangium flavigriseum TaxID=373681 RepID=A0A8J3LLR0_9ACTN|nr:hypothetical protein [Planosporangium flavigriseum]NJC65536.1 hypothetical protein [Planosporangium flavigriseum]GIG75027.1 hypothetical protein Pfl04_34310 [Planosporangium flavigriseum]